MNQPDLEVQSEEGRGYTSEMTTFIDVNRDRFPFCIVWTAIPCLTWFFPVVGHMAIADSKGVIYDFAGPYTIGEDDMGTSSFWVSLYELFCLLICGCSACAAFGRPVRYLQLDPRKAKKSVLENDANGGGASGSPSTEQNWDRAVDLGNQIYSRRMHNLW
jgi:hypothetical protein